MSVSENPYAPPTATASARGKEWMKTDTAALSKTAIGLSLVYYGIVLFLLSIILMFGAPFFLPALFLAGGGIMIASVMMFVGAFVLPIRPRGNGMQRG